MRIRPVAGWAAILFVLAGAAVAVHGEKRAQELERWREDRLATYPERIRELRRELSSPDLDANVREQLEGELEDRESGFTGIPSYFASNARNSGILLGLGLAAMGIVCLFYRPEPKE